MNAAVKFEDVYKEYPYYQHISAGLKTFVFQLRKSVALMKKRRFVALRDVSFEIGRGETFGFIGRNGAGKSTVLGLIAGVIRQDSGSVATCGRISSLLELGAGFHPDLSGLENIILNGILMGNTRKAMLAKIDEIIDFSELGDFVYQPLRTYSSGMQIRLGFSIAVNTNPEILLVDEALAVGDIGFQEKCAKKMLQFKSQGATIILVSHEMEPISKICDRVAWLDCGEIMKVGAPEEVIADYLVHVGQKTPSPEIDLATETPAEEGPEEEVGVAPQKEALEKEAVEASEEEAFGTDGGSHDEDGDSECGPERSWWNLPPVMQHCEELITGSRNLRFHDYLKREFIAGQREAGVSLCHNLKGIERNLVDAGICKSFLVLGEEAESALIDKSTFDFAGNSYGLFLCVDVLHRVRSLDQFMACVEPALAADGLIIAIEYVGSSDHKLYGKAREAADIAGGIFFREGAGETSEPLAGVEDKSCSRGLVISEMKKRFDILAVRNFAGPLYDHVVNRITRTFDPTVLEIAAGIKAVILLDELFAAERVVDYDYAVIVAGKRNKAEREV